MDGNSVAEIALTMAQADQLPHDLCVAPWRAMELVTAFCLAPALDRGETDPLAEDIYLEAQRLLKDLDVVFAAENRRAIILWMRRINAHRDEYRKSLLLWLDVIEEVAFEVEKDLGDKTGPVKLRRVKGAVFYLLQQMTKGLEVPGIPRYLNRFGLHFAIRGTVEFIVTLDNPEKYQQGPGPVSAPERKLWGSAPRVMRAFDQKEAAQGGFFDRLDLRDSRLVVATLKWWEPKADRLTNWILDKLLAPPLVSPRFKRKVDELILQLERNIDPESISDKSPIEQMFSVFFEVIRWIGRHGNEVRAAIDALSISFHLTAELTDMDRNRRIEVVKEALILYFEERGLTGPYFRFMLRIVVDIGLDALQFLYQKQQERPA
jgi:hypothetical protein